MSITIGTKLARLEKELLSDGFYVYNVLFFNEEGEKVFEISMDSKAYAEELLKMIGIHSVDVLAE